MDYSNRSPSAADLICGGGHGLRASKGLKGARDNKLGRIKEECWLARDYLDIGFMKDLGPQD